LNKSNCFIQLGKLSKSAVNLSKVKNVTETRSELQEPANLVRNSMSTFDLRPGSNIKKGEHLMMLVTLLTLRLTEAEYFSFKKYSV